MKRFKIHTIPRNAHPLVRRLYAEMNEQRIGPDDLAARAGVYRGTIKEWRYRRIPRVDMLEACFNVLGFYLRPVAGKPLVQGGGSSRVTPERGATLSANGIHSPSSSSCNT